MDYYENYSKHLMDYFELLDLELSFLFEHFNDDLEENPFDMYKSIVISKEEVSNMLTQEDSTDINTRLIEQIKNKRNLINQKEKNTKNKGIYIPFLDLIELFSLKDFEIYSIVLSLATELNLKYERIYAYLQDNLNLKKPTFELVSKILDLDIDDKIYIRNHFHKNHLFIKMILKDDELSQSFFNKKIILDERIINFLIEGNELDYDIKEFVKVFYHENFDKKLYWNSNILNEILEFIKKTIDYNKKIIYMQGPNGSGKKFQIKCFAKLLNENVLFFDIKKVLDSSLDFSVVLMKFIRETILTSSIPVFYNFEEILKSDYKDKEFEFYKEIKNLNGIIFILSKEKIKDNKKASNFIVNKIELKNLDEEERKDVWQYFSLKYKLKEFDYMDLGIKYNFSIGEIKNILKIIRDYYNWKNHDNIDFNNLIYKISQDQISHNLNAKATRVESNFTFNDLVLPKDQKNKLESVYYQVKNSHTVFKKWGFKDKLSYGTGLSVLFYGPPGTGKTMSANVLAKELNLELYKIDLNRVVSKYIGETEKNLNDIFEEAKKSNVILFFDEADSLFGKRSEVKDSKDRYSNMETSYLLQKMEEYEGMTILATNFLKNIDSAFLRRINYVINFPFPDSRNRINLWKKAFTKNTPLCDFIDYEFLGEKFHLSGGNIKNIALKSAFKAARENDKIYMKHILASIKEEMEKMGKLFTKNDLHEYKDLLDEVSF